VTDDATFEEEAAPSRCPACLATVEPDQHYCLACGERLTPAGPGDPLRPTGKPPTWIAIAVGLLLLLIGGFGIAYGFTRDDDGGSTVAAGTTVTTAGSSAVPPTASSVVVPTFTSVPGSTAVPTFSTGESVPTFSTVTTEPTATTTGTTSSTPTTTLEEQNDWPSGKDGFAVLLMSRDSEQFDFAYITQQKQAAISKGISNAGVLNSDDYFTLNPGYWVLYMGPYNSKSAAQAAVPTAVSHGYTDAYVRRVAE
jgi:hypothetical protein